MRQLWPITFLVLNFLQPFLVPMNLFSQESSAVGKAGQLTPASDTLNTDNSLFIGAGLGSNMVYLGSTISDDQPYGYSALSYGFGNEFYASVTAIHLGRFDPFVAFYTGSLTYNHVFNSWFDISAGLSRYQVVNSLTDTLFNSFTYGDLTVGIDWRLLYTKLSAGVLFSDGSTGYFQLKNSRYFQTPDFFNGKFNISFDPYVNLLMGTLTEVVTTEGESVILKPPYRKWRQVTQPSSTTKVSRSFGLIEVDFGLPVAFNGDRFTIEAEAGYVLPVYGGSSVSGQKGFLFLLSGFFRIF